MLPNWFGGVVRRKGVGTGLGRAVAYCTYMYLMSTTVKTGNLCAAKLRRQFVLDWPEVLHSVSLSRNSENALGTYLFRAPTLRLFMVEVITEQSLKGP